MRNPFLLPRDACLAVMFAVGATLPFAHGLEPTEWKNRQPLAIDQAGLVKIALPPETLGLARPGLEDLRLLDPAGREVPYVFTRPTPTVLAVVRSPASFHTTLTDQATQVMIETGTDAPLECAFLVTPAPSFLKAARVEVSGEDGRWETVAENTVVFRQFGAEQLRLDLGRRRAAHVRVTLDDGRSRPVPITGARLHLTGTAAPDPTVPIAVRLVRREEFAGESVITLDLGGAHVPLASLRFETGEPLFARPLVFATRELQDTEAVERTLGSGTIWRVAADGLPVTANLEVPTWFTSPTRELLVHVTNGDSPPLAINQITARQRAIWLVFRAAEPGAYAVLTGHPQVAAPRYDLAPLATALRDTPPSDRVPGPAVPNPGYRAVGLLADTPIRGAALDPAPWQYRKSVQIAAAGVQQVELDLDVLARAQSSFADVRLVRDGTQLPHLLERPALSRNAVLEFAPADDSKRPRLSRWQIKLPRAALPISRLTLTSSTPLFQRRVRLLEKVADERRGESVERVIAEGEWSHKPGETGPLVLRVSAVPVGSILLLETDNGDNPPIALSSAVAAYPVTRLLFKSESASGDPAGTGGLSLYYGNRAVAAPRYDLALIAGQILTAEKAVAALGREEQVRGGGWTESRLGGSRAGVLFWAVLAGVVIGLLVVVAKLLPKPTAPKT